MDAKRAAPTDIDDYLSRFPPDIQARLEAMRATIRAAAPGATECISYQMPAFRQKGILVYFAAAKNHIGFYPTGSGVKAFEQELGGFTWSKGAIQFPLDQPLPLELVTRITAWRAAEDKKKR